jgi:hypothetical protein
VPGEKFICGGVFSERPRRNKNKAEAGEEKLEQRNEI